MKISSLFAALVVSVSLSTLASARAGERTLDDCFRGALKRSEVLATQAELVTQAEERYAQAKGSVLPTVSGQVQYFWQDPYNGPVASASTNNNTQQWRLNATQPLFRGFREFAGIRQARLQTSAQSTALQTAVISLFQDTSQAFYNLVSLLRDLDTVESELKLFDKRISELRQRQSIGRSREAEVLTTQSAQVSLRATASQLRGQIESAREVLAFLTGLERDVTPIDQEPVPGALKPIENYLDGIEARPDIRAQRETLAAAEEGIAIARGGHLPSVDLSGNYYLARSGLLADQKWDVTLGLSVPIYQGGVISSQVRTAASQSRAAELALSNARRGADRDVRSLYATLSAERTQVDDLKLSTQLAERNFSAQTKEYRNGLVTNLDVLQALTSFYESLRALDRARFSTKLDFIRLETTVARRPVDFAAIASQIDPTQR